MSRDDPLPSAIAIANKAFELYFSRKPVTIQDIAALQLALLGHTFSPRHNEKSLRQTAIARQILADISRSIILLSSVENADSITRIEGHLQKLMAIPNDLMSVTHEKHEKADQKSRKKRRVPVNDAEPA